MTENMAGLLARLKTLSPNQIYFLSSKAYVLRGFEYYAQERLTSYTWDRTYTTLAASVRGTSQYLVRFGLDHGPSGLFLHLSRVDAGIPLQTCYLCAPDDNQSFDA